jgi:hypothetical protein
MTVHKSKKTIDAIIASSGSHAFVEAFVLAAICSWKMSRKQRRQFYAMMGKKGKTTKPTLADFKARHKLSRLLIKALHRHWQKHRDEYRYLSITVIHSIGNTTDNKPEVALKLFKAKCRKAIAALNVKAIGMIECQGIMNYPGGKLGRTLMFHGHFIGYALDIGHVGDAVDKLNASRAWTTTFGVDPIVVEEVSDGPGHVEWLAHYFSKGPHDAKNLMPHKDRPGRVRMMNTIIGYRPEFALRIYEGLSQTLITDALFCVGAMDVLNPVRKRLLAWHKKRSGPVLRNKAIAKLWRDLRIAGNGSDRFLPYRFLTGPERPKPVNEPVVIEWRVRRAGGGMRTEKRSAIQRLMIMQRGGRLDDI